MAAVGASSSSSSSLTRWIYDVFLNFKGDDTGKNFVDHLYVALQQKGIYTFKDDEKREKGISISPELRKAIKESRFAIVVFSKSYATSSWCLDELAEIIECNKNGQTVLPVFYNVDPSEVRKQTGNFAEAFAKHEERFCENKEKVQTWREALVEAANLSGWDLNNIANGYEAKFIQEIVQEIFKKLGSTPISVAKYEVGIVSRVNKVISLLDNRSKNVHIVGICGTGGIGKTTIAKAVYNRIFDQFESCCFLGDVKEVSEQRGLVCLQKQLLNDILMEEDSKIYNIDYGICVMKKRLCYKKVLVVLDDVDHLKQLESLVGGNDWFGFGSTIIITTRDERLLVEHKIDHEIYKAELLNDDEALELFSWHAFMKNHPVEDYLELSRYLINYAKGLPLALQVLGSFLFGRSKKEWEHELDNLKRIPNREIHDVLKISFDRLNNTEKDLFLDIACFFKGYDKDYVMDILGSSGFYPRIPILIERSLITISDKKLHMHDLIQEMGKEIVRQESPDEPGKRSRLWFHEDVYKVLKENTVTETIKGIMLNLPYGLRLEELRVNVDIFAKMKRLKLLKLRGIRPCGRLSYLSNELCYLDWDGYPERYLPSSFHPQNLVHLQLRNSQIKQISTHIKFLGKLKLLHFRNCPYLDKTPDLSSLPCLEDLNLQGCADLVEVHLSSGVHERLVSVNLSECKKLRSLPRSIHLKNLEYLVFSKCSKLETFPEIRGDMDVLKELDLHMTAIKDLPASIENLGGLQTLLLGRCKKLKSLPTNMFSRMKVLRHIEMQGTGIKQLPSSFQHLSNLIFLILDDFQGRPSPKMSSSLMLNSFLERRTPNSTYLQLELLSHLCTVTHLELKNCNLSEESLPNNFGHLSSLEELDLSDNKFTSIPASFIQLTKLNRLYLERCTRLRTLTSLPPSVFWVNANGCESLEWYWFPPCVDSPDNRGFRFTGCHKLDMNQSNNMPNIYSQSHLQEIGQILFPGSEIPQWFSHKIEGEGSSVCLGVDDHHLHSYNNVKEFVFCVAFKLHGIIQEEAEVVIKINGHEFCRWLYQDKDIGLHNAILTHVTEYYDEYEKAIRPIRNLLNKNPSIELECVEESNNKEVKVDVKKWGIHLVMEEQVETSQQG
ncbi:disease resistance protein RUN1-like [Cornus florida]|uniref:disease resistance protein RUN1-like n=1 Tax=Cornus florida TaxID=4283 RepID=UPI0028A0942F|nr:disease resistance protein RUN1-like [Cornus florida]